MIRLDTKTTALYAVAVLADVCATMPAEMHEYALRRIFPRIARVRNSAEIELSREPQGSAGEG